LCFAIGAVVEGVPTTRHTPLSGQRSPVRAVVPIGVLVSIILFTFLCFRRQSAVSVFDTVSADHHL
jgi:hypothetical protein